jgi:hypothetical protein
VKQRKSKAWNSVVIGGKKEDIPGICGFISGVSREETGNLLWKRTDIH